MAARWQQWMPFHIDRFRGSPDVQAMHPAARCGLLYLLAAAWQTEDCSLSSDPMELATASGLGDELWAQYSVRILRKFQARDGRLVNAVLLAEWIEARAVYDKRRAGAVRTNEGRTANAERAQSERSSDTGTGTGTKTETGTKQAQVPLKSIPARHREEFSNESIGTAKRSILARQARNANEKNEKRLSFSGDHGPDSGSVAESLDGDRSESRVRDVRQSSKRLLHEETLLAATG